MIKSNSYWNNETLYITDLQKQNFQKKISPEFSENKLCLAALTFALFCCIMQILKSNFTNIRR